MLVVQVHWHHRYSGATTHLESICAPLAKDFEVRWLGSKRPEGVPAITVGEVRERARHEPVLWHAHRNNDLMVGCGLRALHPKLKVVFTRHGSYPPSAFSRMLARWPDAMITLNEENAGWMKAPSVVIPHGVDTVKFSPPPSREQAWAALGQGGRHGLGVVGRVRPNKGQGDFVEAIQPLLPKFPEWRAALVGLALGDDLRWAEQLKAKTNGALLLPGETREIVRWYQGFTVLVNPSHGESFGLTMVEGMACGCCVVASRLFHVPQLIEHGRTGFIYEPHDVKALREILEQLMREPERAVQVGRNAAEEAKARLGITTETDAIGRVYRSLA